MVDVIEPKKIITSADSTHAPLGHMHEGMLSAEYLHNQEHNDSIERILRDIRYKTDTLFVSYHFTQDPQLVDEYCIMRERCYRESLGLMNFSGAEDTIDHASVLLLSLWYSDVIGGLRLTVRRPGESVKLPLEVEGFYLNDLFPDLDLANETICEVSRFAVLSPYRVRGVADRMIEVIVKKNIKLNCRYHFAIAPAIHQIRYKRTLSRLGVKLQVCEDIPVPSLPVYEGIPMFLSVTDFTPLLEKHKQYTSIQDDVAINA